MLSTPPCRRKPVFIIVCNSSTMTPLKLSMEKLGLRSMRTLFKVERVLSTSAGGIGANLKQGTIKESKESWTDPVMLDMHVWKTPFLEVCSQVPSEWEGYYMDYSGKTARNANQSTQFVQVSQSCMNHHSHLGATRWDLRAVPICKRSRRD